MSGRSDCRKFAPNIFNKSKCTNCFRQKEEHSAEALESNRSRDSFPTHNTTASGRYGTSFYCFSAVVLAVKTAAKINCMPEGTFQWLNLIGILARYPGRKH
ncbi:unnamed protein product [Arctia plantaginis]|uniref:Uncharacterized protein n=1 Tax=Arctia plantaginis TaxID=874455 RepID=A0A8S0YPX7_ARCPL|nr:unnamed protein product [Arctia plantaginis]